MRPSQKNRNGRNKSGRKPSGNVINRVFESAGPEGKVRGTPQQIIDKYLLLARDAQTAGDRVNAENFQQHAEHYARLLSAAQEQQEEHRRNLARQQGLVDQPDAREDGQDASRVDDESGSGERNAATAAEPGEQPAPRRERSRRRSGGEHPSGSGMETIDAEDDASGPVATPEAAKKARKPEAEADVAEAAPAPRRRRRAAKPADDAPPQAAAE